MAIKKLRGTSPARRFMTKTAENLTRQRPLKSLVEPIPKTGGRDRSGKISVRHKGGRHKRLYRLIDFKRDKFGVPSTVVSIEYDPNRTSLIAQVNYADGEKRYILAPNGIKIGDKIISGEKVEVTLGNTMPLKNTPLGTQVHNIELIPSKGGQLARSAGSYATLMAKEGGHAHLRLPSGEIRKAPLAALATIGTLGNIDWKNITFGKAGRKRHLGIRPTVRGVAMSPRDHPHGGGEGKSGIGMSSPKSPWGKRTLGKKTRKKGKNSDKFIITKRK